MLHDNNMYFDTYIIDMQINIIYLETSICCLGANFI